MKFAAQSWLWFLLALPLVYFVLVFDENRRKKRFARFAREATWKSIAPETDHSSGIAKARIWLLAMGFAILAMARPNGAVMRRSLMSPAWIYSFSLMFQTAWKSKTPPRVA